MIVFGVVDCADSGLQVCTPLQIVNDIDNQK